MGLLSGLLRTGDRIRMEGDDDRQTYIAREDEGKVREKGERERERERELEWGHNPHTLEGG